MTIPIVYSIKIELPIEQQLVFNKAMTRSKDRKIETIRQSMISEDLVVRTLPIDEVREQLEGSLRLSLRHHVTSSLHSYHSQVRTVNLIEPSMLILHTPRTPSSRLFHVQSLHVLLCVSEWHLVVEVPAEQPHPDCSIEQNLPVFFEGASHGD